MSKIISVYDFSVNIDFFHYLVNKANVFLKEMRRDRDTKDFWKDYNYYNISKISHEYKLNVETDILIELKKLSISERLLFFDFAEKINDNKYKQYNREIIYNKWEPIQEKPVVYYLRGSKQNISI